MPSSITYGCYAGLLDYRQALALQNAWVEHRLSGQVNADLLIALEHPPVFTLGSRGGTEYLKVSTDALAARRIEVVETGRGGVITYHGPGQLVLYPIVDLKGLGLKVGDFIDHLEALMIELCAAYGVRANRDARNRGVWVGDEKLGSLGIRLRRSITFHGLALNLSTDLEPFEWIDPCGLIGTTMTSVATITGTQVGTEQAAEQAFALFEQLFNRPVQRQSLAQIETMLAKETHDHETT